MIVCKEIPIQYIQYLHTLLYSFLVELYRVESFVPLPTYYSGMIVIFKLTQDAVEIGIN